MVHDMLKVNNARFIKRIISMMQSSNEHLGVDLRKGET
jgi:hypothetical protein